MYHVSFKAFGYLCYLITGLCVLGTLELQIIIIISVRGILFQGALSGLRQFLATKTPLKMMKNAFYFTLKAPLVLKIFKFLF